MELSDMKITGKKVEYKNNQTDVILVFEDGYELEGNTYEGQEGEMYFGSGLVELEEADDIIDLSIELLHLGHLVKIMQEQGVKATIDHYISEADLNIDGIDYADLDVFETISDKTP